VLFPGFVAGVNYTTPRMGGLDLSVGLYDPIRLRGAYDIAPYPRPEAAITGDWAIGTSGKVHFSVETLWQYLQNDTPLDVNMDGITEYGEGESLKTSAYGIGGSLRGEFGPVRLGFAGWQGRGLGIWYALTNSPATFLQTPRKLRTFSGAFAQLGLVFGDFHVGVGAGQATVAMLDEDLASTSQSLPKSQSGASLVLDYHIAENLVVAADLFLLSVRWQGAVSGPEFPDMLPGGTRLPGEEQDLIFTNLGTTFHW
jgi:hypothetical protein